MAHRHSNLIDVVLAWAHKGLEDMGLENGQGRRRMKESRRFFDQIFDMIVAELKVKKERAKKLGIDPEKASKPLSDFHMEVAQARARDTLAWHETQAEEARRKAGLADNDSDDEQKAADKAAA
jgi:hypothetical protein